MLGKHRVRECIFLKETGCEVQYILDNEADLLREKGITEPEQQMMLYIL